MDLETERFVQAKVETVSAQNDARFARIETQLSKIGEQKIPSLWQFGGLLAGGLATALAIAIAIAAAMSDRFDGGITARGLIDPMLEQQRLIDAAQDEKLDDLRQGQQRMLNILENQKKTLDSILMKDR